MSKDWDRIRIEGDGKSASGHVVRVYRNGEMIHGVVDAVLEASVNGVQTLRLTQYVVLEKQEVPGEKQQ